MMNRITRPSSPSRPLGRALALIGTIGAFAIAATAWPVSAQAQASAQSFPNKRMTVIVPLGAGSSTDIFARVAAQAITEATGQPVVVENRTGAEGAIGAKAVATADPDGYTVMVSTSSTQVINVHLYKSLPYDPIKDFEHVTPMLTVPLALWVNANSSMNSVADVIARARQEAGKMTFGSSTATMRLSGEMFKQRAGVEMTNVPYRATAAALVDLFGQRIDVVFTDGASAAAQKAAGNIKPLAVMVPNRVSSMPDIPTIAEAGVKGYDLTVFFGVWAPAGTPAPVVARLNQLFAAAMQTPRMVELLGKSGAERMTMSPDEFRQFMISQIDKLAPVVRAASIEKQ